MMKCRTFFIRIKVMQSSAVQTAMMYNIPLEVRSTLLIEKELKFLVKKALIIQKV